MAPPSCSSTDQFTALLSTPTTVATNVCVSPEKRVAFAGVIVTVTFANDRRSAWPGKRSAHMSIMPARTKANIFTPGRLASSCFKFSACGYAVVCDHGYRCAADLMKETQRNRQSRPLLFASRCLEFCRNVNQRALVDNRLYHRPITWTTVLGD